MLSHTEQKQLLDALLRYEGKVNHMYLDSNGYVTVGIGHLLANRDAAMALPFQRAPGWRAEPFEIGLEYDRLRQLSPNRLPSYYRTHTRLHLSDTEIDRLTLQHIETFHRELRSIYAEFDELPSSVRLALFDLIFNVGQTSLRNRWPRMNAAIAARDWATAAVQSRRAPPIPAARNDYVRKLFEQAAENR